MDIQPSGSPSTPGESGIKISARTDQAQAVPERCGIHQWPTAGKAEPSDPTCRRRGLINPIGRLEYRQINLIVDLAAERVLEAAGRELRLENRPAPGEDFDQPSSTAPSYRPPVDALRIKRKHRAKFGLFLQLQRLRRPGTGAPSATGTQRQRRWALRSNAGFGGRWQSTPLLFDLLAGRCHTEGRRARHSAGMAGLASRPLERSDGDKGLRLRRGRCHCLSE